MTRPRKRAKPAKPAAREIVRLKAPAGCAPFKRGGRRYVPSHEGLVVVPKGLAEDLIAHGFAPLAEDDRPKPAARSGAKQTGGKSNGDG